MPHRDVTVRQAVTAALSACLTVGAFALAPGAIAAGEAAAPRQDALD